MTFHEALNEVITTGRMVWRKMHQFEDDYDRPYPDQSPPTPWSIWLRIRLWDDNVDDDALVYFESNNRNDVDGSWFLDWKEDQISRADILASDWEIIGE
jgi:hypothetical protein